MSETPRTSKRFLKRKGINLERATPDNENSRSCVCNNAACRATMAMDDRFCKRCSCCICKQFDDNKDPSLWLVCNSEYDDEDFCGSSCHVECAIISGKVGITGHGQSKNLDGSYCCASCGKVSLILGCWKKQLMIAKDARRVDVQYERISLCYRLLKGTRKFQELHKIVEEVMAELERELGPVSGISGKMSRGSIASRLPIAEKVQKLCALAIERADEWQKNDSAWSFRFEEITSSSVVIVLIEPPSSLCADIKGYKIWYCQSKNETLPKEPTHILPRSRKEMLVSNLQPLTEYSFKVSFYSEAGDISLFEANCFTKSANIPPNLCGLPDLNEEIPSHFNTTMSEDYREPLSHHMMPVYDCVPRIDKKVSLRSDGSGVSTNGEMPAVNSQRVVTTIESGCMLTGSHQGISKELGDSEINFDYCVKVICKLEGGGHIEEEFRKKFLTWFSLRSTEHEKRVVKTFIQFIDDSSSLAAQLVDTFSDIVNFKKPRNDF